MSRLTLSPHALQRCQEMGLTHRDVAEAVTSATRSYPSNRKGKEHRVYCDGHLAVVVACDFLVITVLWDGSENRESSTLT